ncbi:zinc finger protein ZAT2-like [Dioscorea cayenensis subsp. rotundata]|uniref:Zinc finger protein ZAT2-like n=1 Tax=Dioscorea cayennensis subsp. rotundata TaxID=55577 RepID=A0AB40C3M2_DIOCR|nr:zinc finger protein ZAT2-like [Dioscorea cayenensis subsp. rotundata]
MTMEKTTRKAIKKLKNRCEGDPPLESGLAANSSQQSKKRTRDAGEVIHACTECGKNFWSRKAVYGHMRLHPDRAWRGINPPDDADAGSLPKKEKDVAASLVLLSGDVDAASPYQCSREGEGGSGGAGAGVVVDRVEEEEEEEQEKKPVLDLDFEPSRSGRG